MASDTIKGKGKEWLLCCMESLGLARSLLLMGLQYSPSFCTILSDLFRRKHSGLGLEALSVVRCGNFGVEVNYVEETLSYLIKLTTV